MKHSNGLNLSILFAPFVFLGYVVLLAVISAGGWSQFLDGIGFNFVR